jgi:methylase of polypeptide subunit release factors
MGCGQFAILGQYFKKRNNNSEVTSVDLYDEFVSNSILTMQNINNLKIKIIKSNLFSNLSGKKNLILLSFNPPYVPSSKRDNIEKNYKKIRYSGSDGTLITSKFLIKLKKHLLPTGEILIGINTFYVNRKQM